MKVGNKGVSMYEVIAVTFIITFFFIAVTGIFTQMTISNKNTHDRTFAIDDAQHTYDYMGKIDGFYQEMSLEDIINNNTFYLWFSDDSSHEGYHFKNICSNFSDTGSNKSKSICETAFKVNTDSNKRDIYFYSYNNKMSINTLKIKSDIPSSFKSYLNDLTITDGMESDKYIRMSIIVWYDDKGNSVVNHYLWEV